MVPLERPARVVVKLEVQQGHHGHGLEVKVPLEILTVIFAAMVTDIFLTSFTPLLVDRITRVEYGPLAKMLLIASLHLDYQPAAIFALARDVEDALAVLLGQTEMFRGDEIHMLYLHILQNHVEKSAENILVGLAAEKTLEHEVAL